MSAHTPGPWEFDVIGREGNPNDPWHCAIVGTAIGRHVVIADTLNCSCVFSPDDQRANARLIAAAPELLEACEMFTAAAHDARDALNAAGISCPASIALAAEKARAAIAKAEGST